MAPEPYPLLVYVERRYGALVLRWRFFWEVLDADGRKLNIWGIETFGWAFTERGAYNRARRRKWGIRVELHQQREATQGAPGPEDDEDGER